MPVNNKRNSAAINQAAGAVIRSLRKEKNLSGYDLGCLTGLSQQQISRYERGSNHLTLNLLIEILLALDTTLMHRDRLSRRLPLHSWKPGG